MIEETSTPQDKLLILLVEDNRDNAEAFRILLSMCGHDVVVAFTGAEAIEVAEQLTFDAVLCDISLPGGISGFDVTRKFKTYAHLSMTAFIAMTGYDPEDLDEDLGEAGFHNFLIKPVFIEDLERCLAKSLEIVRG